MDSSCRSFKAVLINKESLKVIPVAYSKVIKETKNLLQIVLKQVKYHNNQWEVCADFKIVGLLMGIQPGYVQHGCYICQWQSRAKEQYTVHEWPLRSESVPGQQKFYINLLF